MMLGERGSKEGGIDMCPFAFMKAFSFIQEVTGPRCGSVMGYCI